MTADLKATFEDLASEPDLRLAVLSGAGDRAFAAGADIRVMATLEPDSARAFITGLHEAIAAIRAMPVPVIAMINGYCFGAAVEIAAACDFRIGDTSVVIGMPEVKVGVPSVIEAVLLPGLIGAGRTREMLLTGMNYDAEAAYHMHFLDHLCAPSDLRGAVEERITHILDSAPAAVRSQRALLNAWENLSLADGIALSIDHFEAAFRTDEPKTYMAPFVKNK